MRRSAPQAGEPSGGRETKRGRRLAMERKARKANSPQPLQPSFPRQRIFNGRKRAQPGEGSARSAAEAKRGFPDSPGARLLRLERKVAAAEERWAGCEKNVVEMGSQLEGRLAALGTLMEENGLLQRRLENLENLLKNRNFWILRFPPGSNGETPKVPVTFNDTSVSFNAQEWGNLEEWQKEMFKVVMRSNYEMLVSLDDAISKPTFLSQIERGEDPSAKEAGDLEEEDIPVDPGCSGSSVIVVNAASWGQEDEKEEEDGPGTVFLEVASPDDAISKPEFLCHIEGSDEPSAKDPDDLEESDMPVDPSCSGSSMIIVNAASWGRGDGKEEVAAILALQEDSQGAALLEDSSPDLPSSRDVGSQVKQELEEKPIKEEPLSPGSPTDDESFIPVCIKQEEEEQEEQSMEDQPYLVYFADHSQPLPMAGAEQGEGPATESSVSSCGKDPEAKEAEVQGCLALCGMCNQSVSNRETLGDHQYSRKHKLHCTECNRSFAFQGQLSQHMLVHLQGIQLHCDHCNLCFSSQKALEVHKRVHLLDWPLHCSICNCSFSDAASFDHHQQSHAPGQVRRCLECNVYFTDSLALQEHKRTHAEDWPFRCAQCDRTFVHEGLLREHLLNHSRTRSRRCHICGSWLSYRGMELSEGQLYYCRKCKTSCHVQGSPGAVAAAAVAGSPDKGSA
ncbi:zinc finger protein 777-like isoform X1 [Anolis sagrei]|uniref:zinc finger protein 777-like isoform X1 n=2 Tax=Anolis sagrei TaxID=38937 RepID=UPI0035202B7F